MGNTVEQLLLNSGGQLILTTLLSEQEMRIIPLLSTLFLLGRIAFHVGYQPDNPRGRAFGFCVSAIPSVAMVAVCWRRFVPHVLGLFR